jgi:uncharacterized protein DUF6551
MVETEAPVATTNTSNTSKLPGKFERYAVQWLRIGDLVPHPLIQRPYDKAWAEQIAEQFDPDKFGQLEVIPYREKYRVFYGQHRLAAARMRFGDDQKVPCHVHDAGLTIEAQATLVLGLDRVKGWTRIQTWRVRALAKDPQVVAIQAILEEQGLVVENNAKKGVVRAVSALESVYRHSGAPGLTRVLTILSQAYQREPDAYDAILLKGVGLLVSTVGAKLDDADLIRKMSRESGAGRLAASARDYAKSSGLSTERAMAHRLVTLYNKNRRKDLLKWID